VLLDAFRANCIRWSRSPALTCNLERDMADKRQEKRLRRRLPLKFGSDGLQRTGFTEDLSAEGFYIKTVHVLAPNTRVMVELSPPGKGVILLEGVVRWRRQVPLLLLQTTKGGIGVRITRFLSGEDIYREIIEELRSR
jgi:hypothetical protein